MAEIIVDTNFLITCVKQKIDFFEFAKLNGFKVIIPEQVITELSKIISSKQKKSVRDNASLSLKMINLIPHKKINLETRYVDLGIINYLKKNPKTVVATLDREIQKKNSGNTLIIRGLKKLEII
jgi:rRNA-processing protein FCF1